MPLLVPSGCEYFPMGGAPPDSEEMVRLLAFREGESYSSYMATEDGWETFWCPDRRGVVRFTRRGRYVYNTGGLLTRPEDRPFLLEQFNRFLKLNRLQAHCACIGREQLATFRAQGYQVSKCGEEPIIRLGTATWRGKAFEWLRRQENYCRRQKLVLIEVDPDPDDRRYREEIVPELEDISRQHVASTVHGRELRCFVSRFTPLQMQDRRLFVARQGERIEAFVVCNPCLDGTMWAIEMFRHREDAPRGVVPFAMLQILRLLQEEGVAYCSLSAMLAVRATKPIKGDSVWARGACYLLWHHFNWLYDVRGIYHFKSRFRPEMRELYFVSWPRTTLLSMIGFGCVWGLFSVRWWSLLKEVLCLSSKGCTRQTLAEPEFRPARLVRGLSRPKKDVEPTPSEPAELPHSEIDQ